MAHSTTHALQGLVAITTILFELTARLGEIPTEISSTVSRTRISILKAETAEASAEQAESNAEIIERAEVFELTDSDYKPTFRTVEGAILHNVSIEEDEYPEWNKLDEYSRGDVVLSKKSHSVYRSLIDGNSDNDPVAVISAINDPLVENPSIISWQRLSATNAFRLFDSRPQETAVADEVISLTLSTTGDEPRGIGLFGLKATYLEILITTQESAGTPKTVYAYRENLIDDSVVVNMLSYYTAPLARVDSIVVLSLPLFVSGDLVTINIYNSGNKVECGQVVFGGVVDIGTARVGSGFSGLDFSIVDVDEFGNVDTSVRNASKIMDLDIVADTHQLPSLDKLLRSLRGGVPAVWVPSPSSRIASEVYGFYRDYTVNYSTAGRSYLNLEIQGVV